jgi:hypothetical protein
MNWSRMSLRFLGPGLFVASMAVMIASFVKVVSAEDDPPCPACDQVELTCLGSLCYCHQTGVNTGVWACYPPGEGGD